MAGDADLKVRIVGTDEDADASVLVIGGVVVDMSGADDGDVLTVQPDGSVAPEDPSAIAHPGLAEHDTLGLATQGELDAVDAVAQNADTVAQAAIPAAEKGAANGVANLDANTKIPTALLPPIPTGAVFSAASEAAMLALAAQPGDIAIRTDLGQRFILAGADPTVLGNWVQLDDTGAVQSVDGLTGVVSLTHLVREDDYNANTILAADTNDTPVPLTVAASRFVGRKSTGGISAMTAAQALDILEPSAAAWTAHHTFAAGVEVTDDDGVTAVNGFRSLFFARPPTADDEVCGFLVKTPDATWGVGQDYTEGNAIVVVSDANGTVTSPTPILKVISATTNATPVAVTTSTTHGLSTGDTVRVTGTAIGALDSKWWKVTVTSTTAFTLDGSTAPGSTAAVGYAFTDRSPVVYRIDGNGGQGISGGIHVATGLRGRAGSAPPDVGVWVDPSNDCIGVLISNPDTDEWAPTPTADFLRVTDVRGTDRPLLRVEASGTVTLRPQSGKAAATSLFRVVDDAGAADTLIVRADGGLWGKMPSAFGKLAPLATTELAIQVNGDSRIGQAIFASSATQDGDLFVVLNHLGEILFRLDKSGYFITRKQTAPADAALINGDMGLFNDLTTAGLPRMSTKSKDASGNVFSCDLSGMTCQTNPQTASYQLVLADAGKVVELDVATANTLTVPPNATVAFPVGTLIEVHQYGAGQTTLTPGAGVTIRSEGAKLKLTGQYASAGLRKRATNEWVASGSLVA